MSIKNNYQLQIRFFDKIRDVLPPSVSLANEIADVLETSVDSAYRRLRGETPLSIDETALLCNHFKVAFDLIEMQNATVTFSYNNMGGFEGFHKYLSDILSDLQQLSKIENSELFYAAVDIPIVHNFKYPELSTFKMFYWLKAVLNEPVLENQKFNTNLVPEELRTLGKKVYDTYTQLKSTEIWDATTVNCTLTQIEFYWDAGLFSTKNDALLICSQFEEQLKTIEKQAEKATKVDDERVIYENNFMLYISDIEIGNNSILSRKGKTMTTYLSFHTFNKLVTMNPAFCEATENWISNIVKKSTLISGVSEKLRYRFFKTIYDKIEKLKTKITND